MKIAIPATEKDLKSKPSPVFGRCPYFAIVDTEDGNKFVNNGAENQRGGAGIAAAESVGDEGVQAVIADRVGPNAFRVLDRLEIEVYEADLKKTIEENIQSLRQGKLNKIEGATGGPGMGRRGR
ncbi:MAG: NifB/NifX family molybdenum-iron cluster-binding protein [Candidatus Aenigmatarchaeota archaeon]